MGIGTILDSREILLLASGESKAQALRELFEGKKTEDVPATAIQEHENVTVIADEAALRLVR